MSIADPRATKYETVFIRPTGLGLFVQATLRSGTDGSSPLELDLVEGKDLKPGVVAAAIALLTALEADGGPIDAAYAAMVADPTQFTDVIAEAKDAVTRLATAQAQLAEINAQIVDAGGQPVDVQPTMVRRAKRPKKTTKKLPAKKRAAKKQASKKRRRKS